MLSADRLATPRRRRALRGALIAFLATVLLAGVTVVALRVGYSDRVLPGTRVAGVSLGGKSPQDARRRLAAVANRDRVVSIVGAGRRLTVRPSVAGYRVDLDATVAAAMRSGRARSLGGAWATLTGVVAPRDVAVAHDVDPKQLRRVVAGLAAQVDRPPFAGAIEVDAQTLTVRMRAPRDGLEVDRDALAARLRRMLLERKSGQLAMAIERRELLDTRELERLAQAARAYLRAPLRLTAADSQIVVPTRRLAAALVLKAPSARRRARLGVDAERLREIVEGVAETIDRPARDAQLSAPALAGIVTGKGDVSWLPRRADARVVAAQSGRAVRRERLAAAIERAVGDGRHGVRVPMRTVTPAVSAAQARRARWLIGTFTTNYPPAQPRVVNIRRIAAVVDGTVIAPGARFSLNGIAGPRTREKGYVEAPFIADGKIVPSVGGGVSQFSTTMYNAAYFAGLPIEAYRPHSLFIDRYPPGREATLNYPDIDLVWINDTQTPVFVRAATTATSVTVGLYGDNGRRRVRAVTGAREALPGADFAITVTRIIRNPDGRTERHAATTRYDKPAETP